MTPGRPEEIAREAMSCDYQYAVLSVLRCEFRTIVNAKIGPS